jgi:transcriptional regulator with XRE-family HTH domain
MFAICRDSNTQDEVDMMLHNRLVKLRKDKKLSQEDTAKALGIPRSTYAQYELGRRHPDYNMIQKLADFFGVSIDYLFGRVDHPNLVLTESERKLNDSIGEMRFQKIKELFDFPDATEEDVDKIFVYVELLKLKRQQESR